jgi:hypothetical protein
MANPSYLCQQIFRSERLQEDQESVWCSKRFRPNVAAELRAVEMDFSPFPVRFPRWRLLSYE